MFRTYSILFYFLSLIYCCKSDSNKLSKGESVAGGDRVEESPVRNKNHIFSPSLVSYYLQQLMDSPGFFSPGIDPGIKKKAIGIYRKRNYAPIWELYEKASVLPVQYLDLLDTIHYEGLNAQDYNLESLQLYRQYALNGNNKKTPPHELIEQAINSAKGDMLFTVSFLQLVHHLKNGKVNPNDLDLKWFISTKHDIDLDSLISEIFINKSLKAVIDNTSLHMEQYLHLKKLLRSYYELAGNEKWKPMSSGPSLGLGSISDRVLTLRENLFLTKDLAFYDVNSPANFLFDKELQSAVLSYQQRHGLDPSGIVDNDFITEMNIPLNERINRINLNMERLRWFPDSLGQKYILVNIPDFSLQMIEKEVQIHQMKVIAGMDMRSTPVFNDEIEYIVFSPYWYVPPGIARKDILPKIKKDTSFLFKHHYEVYERADTGIIIKDPAEVKWKDFDEDFFPLRLRQKPGPMNAMGRVKFMFPNNYSIYLHDTPEKDLFEKRQRDFSSGCIRVEEPVKLAGFLLPELTEDEIRDKMDRQDEEYFFLRKPVPVYIVYYTVWVENNGKAIFRKDLYGIDEKLKVALARKAS